MKMITRADIIRAWIDLQSVANDGAVSASNRGVIRGVMSLLDQIQMERRHGDIFAAGACAEKPVPTFEGYSLGSAETMTFYDGFASTHPDFVNPYRRRQ